MLAPLLGDRESRVTKTNRMTRWTAGAIHLLASLAVIGAIAAFVYFRWTPHGLWAVAGVDRPLLLLFGVVLVVGPALTTLVYKPGKRTLRSDLIVVALLQLAFLGYGLWMLARTRPVFLVAAVDRYEVIFANEIDPGDLAQAPAKYQALSWTGPRVVGLQRTASGPAMGPAIVFDTPQQPAYYTDFDDYAPILRGRSKPLSDLAARSAADAGTVAVALRRLGRTEANTRFVPVTSRRKGSAVMLIDAESARPRHALALDPWLN